MCPDEAGAVPAPAANDCFHCGEPVPTGLRLSVTLDGIARPVCCTGCKAAAEFVRDAGLGDYYRYRSAPAPRPGTPQDDTWAPYDLPEVLARHAAPAGEGMLGINLLLEGVRCAACGWLVERALTRIEGVREAGVNPATARVRVEWDPARAPLSSLLRTIESLGYRPHVLGAADTLEVALRERRTALKRLALAGLGMMQVMMYAVALYAGAFEGMDPMLREYLRIVSMFVTTPVFLYSGWPFLQGAWRNLSARQLGMDVPVALGITLAFTASVWNTLRGSGEVYFDSVTMFVFLLLLGRYVEMTARHHAGSTSDALLRLQPQFATRVTAAGTERVSLASLAVGDLLLVPDGEAFPADGTLEDGETAADESLLTGEAARVAKRPGDLIVGGAINHGPAARVRVTAVGHDTVLAGIVRLLERAQTERPRAARLADRWAAWFVGRVLIAAAIVACAWAWYDPSRMFEITLAVLVVSCPCALSLATPTAITAATARLARIGMLVTRADALETLSKATLVVFDKTGTLTNGTPTLERSTTLGSRGTAGCLALAAALEQGSSHPLARAFRGLRAEPGMSPVDPVAGRGLEAAIDGLRFRIGTSAFVSELTGSSAPIPGDAGLWLGSEREWLACFTLSDAPREGAAEAAAALAARGLGLEVASGDQPDAVAAAADAAGIARWRARQQPADKVARVRQLRAEGAVIAMVGDGVNDAPVLRAADVAVAMGAGAALARTSADLVLVSGRLTALPEAVDIARRTVAVVKQNLAWSTAYNLTALPAAAFGLVPPWLAAIGMSLSSLLVVLNALRLAPPRIARTRGPA
ncbi:MAG: cadmium-translocating P-type ATPase [Steroidobacteraceae bacterium]|nr:cadmium-translocating P-type ATPase [Steroidobacteraceae bacterium]MCC7199182.1 cadmium-translocating P-type ATPase [Gammaproteobacteria bacterium]